jgi:ABC-type transporter Mla subunit MlaD
LETEAAALSDALDANADTIAELLASASTVTGSLSTMGTDVETALNDLNALGGEAEIKDAFASAESCQQVDSVG